MVISGVNGSGKTSLLKGLHSSIEPTGRPKRPASEGFFEYKGAVEIYSETSLSGKVRHVGPNFQPNTIGVSKRRDPDQFTQDRTNLLRYIRSPELNDEALNWHVLEVAKRLGIALELETRNNGSTFIASKPFEKLADEQLLNSFPLNLVVDDEDNVANGFVSDVFKLYLQKIQTFKADNYSSEERLTDEEIYQRFGARPPWLEINELFVKYGFSYRINALIATTDFTPVFIDESSGKKLPFGSLSSGEKILVTLILWAYNDSQRSTTKLMLLDEFDAHLNPSLSKMMVEVLNDKIVKEFGIRVILTTHQPSTIAHSPEESLFWMERGEPIRSSSKQEIIPILSDGIITVQPNEALRIATTQLRSDNLPVVLVEGQTDKTLLETAWKKLKGRTEPGFEIVDFFDCYSLINLLNRGDVFGKYAGRQFVGVIDFDSAYAHAKDKLRKDWTRTVCDQTRAVFFRHKSQPAVVTTLIVPEFRSGYAGDELSVSKLSIEHLFPDRLIEHHCKTEHWPGGGKLLKFEDRKKTTFSKEAEGFQKEDFAQFNRFFSHLESLLTHKGA